MKILITGVAGFIGMHTAIRFLEDGYQVVGVDNLNTYYDPMLKNYRLRQLTSYPKFKFLKLDITERELVNELFSAEKFQRVIHLAAQAGVRYSIEAPFEYVNSNLFGTMTILEGCRHNQIEHLVYASSSSVYGTSTKVPFNELDNVDRPVSLYAATKKSNELMAHAYSNLYAIPTTGLRFFTVYGPAGRPDMAPWLFTEAILKEQPIKVFNEGRMQRDFTYIDDIVEGIIRIQDLIPQDRIPYALYNIGNNEAVDLSRFIAAIESATGRCAKKIDLGMQPGDVERTCADIAQLEAAVGYKPRTTIEDGVKQFVKWYEAYSAEDK